MKRLLRVAIRLYRATWPKRWRRQCLFRESCSSYVDRVTKEEGLLEGLAALVRRARACRPGYRVTTASDGRIGLLLRDGTFLPGDEVARAVMAPYRQQLSAFEQSLSLQDEVDAGSP